MIDLTKEPEEIADDLFKKFIFIKGYEEYRCAAVAVELALQVCSEGELQNCHDPAYVDNPDYIKLTKVLEIIKTKL